MAGERTLLARVSATVYINGQWVTGSAPRHAVIEPATERPIGERVNATAEEIEAAVDSDNRAQWAWR